MYENFVGAGLLVDYMIVGNIEKASADLKLQLQILKNLGYFPIDCEDVNFHEYDLLIEGIFGVGLSREVGGVYKKSLNGSMHVVSL